MKALEATILADEVYKRVRELILDGRLPPGGRIERRELAQALGVSPTPLNEAVARLVGERFLERRGLSRGGEGYFVPERPPEELAELFAVRAGLEGVAARLCVERALADAGAAEELEGLCRLFAPFAAAQAGDAGVEAAAEAYLEADKRFHEGIVRLAGNALLRDIDANSGFVHRSWLRGLVRPPEETLPEHLALIGAFRARDARLAHELAVTHNLKSRDRLLGRG